jgi:ABC-2 type transport system ATP-binding protein
MERAFQRCVRDRRADGVTVLLSSHKMGEVESLADRVSLVRRGRTVTSGTLTELRRHTRTAVHAVTENEPAGRAHTDGVADYRSERLEGRLDTRFTIDPDRLDAAIGLLHEAVIHTITATPPSLDDVFLQNYDEASEPGAASADAGLVEASQ